MFPACQSRSWMLSGVRLTSAARSLPFLMDHTGTVFQKKTCKASFQFDFQHCSESDSKVQVWHNRHAHMLRLFVLDPNPSSLSPCKPLLETPTAPSSQPERWEESFGIKKANNPSFTKPCPFFLEGRPPALSQCHTKVFLFFSFFVTRRSCKDPSLRLLWRGRIEGGLIQVLWDPSQQ